MKYSQYEPLLIKIASNKSRNAQEREDMIGTAHLAFVTTCEMFEESRGIKFSTLLYQVASNLMIDEWRKCKKHDHLESWEKVTENGEVSVVSRSLDPARIVEFRDSINQLNKTPREIVKIIIENYTDIFNLSARATPRYRKSALKKILRKRGYKWAEIDNGLKSIHLALTEGA